MSEVENQCATTAHSERDGWQRSRMLTALADIKMSLYNERLFCKRYIKRKSFDIM